MCDCESTPALGAQANRAETTMHCFESPLCLQRLEKAAAKAAHSSEDSCRCLITNSNEREGWFHTIEHSFSFTFTFQLGAGLCIVNIGKTTYFSPEVTDSRS